MSPTGEPAPDVQSRLGVSGAGSPGDGFADRVYLVTGSTRGLGLAVAGALFDRGAKVVVNGRDADAVDELVGRHPGRAVGVAGSVDDDDTVDRCLDAASSLGPLDGIVNNVGMNAFHGPLAEVPRRRWDRTFAVNVTAPLVVVQRALDAGFGVGRPGVVVNMSTVGAQRSQADIGAYCVSKAALDALTRALALELGPRGVRVNAVAPGLVATETSRVLWEVREDELGRARPLGRLGQPGDVAEATLFLLSDRSSWVTGTVLVVDGGALLVGGPASRSGSDGGQA